MSDRNANCRSLQATSLRTRWMLSLAIGILAAVAFLTYDAVRFGLNDCPSATGDEPEYDSIGWELSRGRGFRIDTGNAEFRAPYEREAVHSDLHHLGTPRSGVTAARPPLLPLVIAGMDDLFGRQFWAIRVVNILCLASVCGIMAWLLLRDWGIRTALIGTFLFIVFDTRTRLYSRAILTEAMAALLISVFCLVLTNRFRRKRIRDDILAGAIFALAVLTRSSFILWIPGFLILEVWLARQRPKSVVDSESRNWLRIVVHPVAFLSTMFVVLMPWMVRNCVVTGEFMPMGTQGAAQLPAGFSDTAWKHGGHWVNLEEQGYFAPVVTSEMTLLEREVAMAHYGQQQAKTWILEHPLKSLLLIPLKIQRELFPGDWKQVVLLILAGVGFWIGCNVPEMRIGFCLFVLNCLSVGMTWAVDGGRFFVPLIMIEETLAAIGAAWILDRVFGFFQTPQSVRGNRL